MDLIKEFLHELLNKLQIKLPKELPMKSFRMPLYRELLKELPKDRSRKLPKSIADITEGISEKDVEISLKEISHEIIAEIHRGTAAIIYKEHAKNGLVDEIIIKQPTNSQRNRQE